MAVTAEALAAVQCVPNAAYCPESLSLPEVRSFNSSVKPTLPDALGEPISGRCVWSTTGRLERKALKGTLDCSSSEGFGASNSEDRWLAHQRVHCTAREATSCACQARGTVYQQLPHCRLLGAARSPDECYQHLLAGPCRSRHTRDG